jgi:Spy/CpxP family protein refolding chaperone
MKLIPSLMLAAAFVAVVNPSLRAAERPAGGRGAAGLQQLQQALRELDLTEDQQTKLREFFTENTEKLRGLRDDASLTPQEKLAKFQEFQTAFRDKAKEVLTPEQFAQLEKSRSNAASAAPASENAVKRPESEDAPKPAPATESAPAAGNMRDRMQQGFAELNLTSEQQEKVRGAMQEQAEAFKSLREDTSASREDKVAKFQEMQEKFSAKMKEILNPEQFAKWEKQRGNLAEGLRRRAK